MHHQIVFSPTSRLKQCWEVPGHSTSGVPLGKRSQATFLLHDWDFKNYSLWLPLIISGCKLILSSICEQLAALVSCECSLFYLVKLGMLLSQEIGWPDRLQRFNNLKFTPSYLWFYKSCTHRRQLLTVRVVSRQVRSKVRGLFCFLSEAWKWKC